MTQSVLLWYTITQAVYTTAAAFFHLYARWCAHRIYAYPQLKRLRNHSQKQNRAVYRNCFQLKFCVIAPAHFFLSLDHTLLLLLLLQRGKKTVTGLFALIVALLHEKSTGDPPTELNKHCTPIAHSHTHTHTCHSCEPHSQKQLTVTRFRPPFRRKKNTNSLKGDEEERSGQSINGIVCTQWYGMWYITEPDGR